ncbi:MAG: hypothetical protein SWH68_11455 [Thermodesulfobacteriota bacterium]|nr:hypothetical protein [Thermodesulfobacteriota bacterium]
MKHRTLTGSDKSARLKAGALTLIVTSKKTKITALFALPFHPAVMPEIDKNSHVLQRKKEKEQTDCLFLLRQHGTLLLAVQKLRICPVPGLHVRKFLEPVL